MTKWLIQTAIKFVSYETLVKLIAQAIAYLIDYARNHASEEGWEKAKAGIKEAKNWITLFDEVYEDDRLTEEEDKKIQDAIANCTATTSIYNILQGRKAPRKSAKKGKLICG